MPRTLSTEDDSEASAAPDGDNGGGANGTNGNGTAG
jgi:hypothetical protein